MNRRRQPQPRGLGIAVLALAGMLLVCGGETVALAQVGEGADSPDSVGVDYFARGYDKRAAFTVRTVETHHLADNNFWQRYRDADFVWALSDLLFILRYVPNHPKALYLMSFDPNLNKDPSLIIQHYERALQLYPSSAYTFAQYGHYLVSLGQDKVGVSLLDEALRLDPNLIVARAWRDEAVTPMPGPMPGPTLETASDGKKPGPTPEKTPKRGQ
jgi:tetratricopeptide (TPR) repeat protein